MEMLYFTNAMVFCYRMRPEITLPCVVVNRNALPSYRAILQDARVRQDDLHHVTNYPDRH